VTTADRPDPQQPEENPSGDGSHDIDAEFARLTAGLDLGDDPLTVDDVLSESAEEEEPAIAVVATSVASAKALAGAIRLGREARTDGIDIPGGTRTLDTETGAIAVGELKEQLAHDLAAITSTALQRTGLVLFWRRGDRMTATRYKAGERGEDVSPAIVLGAVADEVEQLLLGALTLDELGEGIDPSTLTRNEALSWISKKKR